ncbi:MAG: energy-coupling factor transporter transmembrane component T [Candidatus Korarchaeota archaeon]|nr:energy-coupling factor transporter transmembrane protein EcfT [Thermoproteota archaeon]
MLDMKSLFQAMIPNRNSPLYESHPVLKLAGVLLVLIILALCSIKVAVLLAVITLAESAVGGTTRNVLQFLRGLKYIILSIGILVFLLNPLEKAILIMARLIIGSIALLNAYTTTRILSMEQVLEKLKLPESAIRATSLTIRLIPLTIKDAEQSIEALALRGIYKGAFRGITQLLSVILANSLNRVEFLTEALVAKYFFMGKRKYPWKLRIEAVSFTLFTTKVLCLLYAISLH